jgi:hypothetical protein
VLLRPHDDLDASRYCGDSLASLLPDPRNAERLTEWSTRANVTSRDVDGAAQMLDQSEV